MNEPKKSAANKSKIDQQAENQELLKQVLAAARYAGWTFEKDAHGTVRMVKLRTDAHAGEQSILNENQKKSFDKMTILNAITSCPHSIDANQITLEFDSKRPGHNALNQLAQRIDALF